MMPLAAALLVAATTGQFTASTPRIPSGTAIPPRRTPGLGRSNVQGVYVPATAALVPREAALWERISAKIEVTDTSLHSYIFVGGGPSQVSRYTSRKRADVAIKIALQGQKGGGSPVLWRSSMHPGLCLVFVMEMCECGVFCYPWYPLPRAPNPPG